MLSGNAIENDRTYNFTAAHTLCRKVGTHSNWDHAASYKKNITKFIKNCMNISMSSLKDSPLEVQRQLWEKTRSIPLSSFLLFQVL